ncbi:MAG: NAD(P)-dependent glycerol-3-phosphate dehydrogenase [Magnetococcales bacterium]|nr:NAD(P)-dependent glycerol-3-phosphate dehydrogenase [Magnetococcales bacterium]
MTHLSDTPSIAVIGAGSWGTALANLLADKYPTVTLWCREQEVADGITATHRNPLYMPDSPLNKNLIAETDLQAVASSHDVLVMVVPTQFTRAVLKQIKEHVSDSVTYVSASKGVEVETLTLISQMYESILGKDRLNQVCYLSGPSFARDVLDRKPIAVSIAGHDSDRVKMVQTLFHTRYFRTYGSDDVVGVELGGALKNVIALAAGISDGLGFGHSARAALITRGLAEINRLGRLLGAHSETFSGLSGMGDLLLTATSDLSRNRRVGLGLGSGKTLEEIQGGSKEVAEGVKTTLSVYRLSEKLKVEMPITRAVYQIIYENRKPKSVVTELMERDLKIETE